MSDDAEHSGAGGEVRFRRRRRRWSEGRKRRIVAESYRPGASVSVVARRHDANANLVFGWRRQYGDLAVVAGSFVPVSVSSTEGTASSRALRVHCSPRRILILRVGGGTGVPIATDKTSRKIMETIYLLAHLQ